MLAHQDFRGLSGHSRCYNPIHVVYHCFLFGRSPCYSFTSSPVNRKDGPRRTIKWFKEDGKTPAIQRDALNQRKTGSAMRGYVKRIFESGIIQSVRGEPWMTYDEHSGTYYALSCGTLLLGTTSHDSMHDPLSGNSCHSMSHVHHVHAVAPRGGARHCMSHMQSSPRMPVSLPPLRTAFLTAEFSTNECPMMLLRAKPSASACACVTLMVTCLVSLVSQLTTYSM